MDIAEYISGEMTKDFEPGKTDCANTADRWFFHRHGFSPMERFGRRVRNEDDMSEWLAEPSGIIRGIQRVMMHSGVPVTSRPLPGDIGIVVVDGRACIALYNGETWWSRDRDGYIFADDSHRYMAWSVD